MKEPRPSNNDTPADFEAIWARVTAARTELNKLSPKPLTESEWKKLENSIRRILKLYPGAMHPPDLELCAKYLAAAEEDERAARLLHAHSHRSLAIYHAQQAVEKAMKAFCLANGMTTPEQVSRDHRTPTPLLQFLGSELAQPIVRFLSGRANKNYRAGLKKVNRLINSDPLYLARLPASSTATNLGIDVLLEAFDSVSHVRPVLDDKEIIIREVIADHIPEHRALITNVAGAEHGLAGIQCYILGVITFAHESYTRYPGHDIEPKDYNGTLGVSQVIGGVIERVPKLISSVRGSLRTVAGIHSYSASDASL